ncbi:Crystal protein ET79 [Glarea lozoyensis ATCC 20868]|uniref:Crystal protein ET79 n=1 Tax=Glarea lozoyensis (strain ATCC 20868 / MF5171) TaxID=1116229 RepID=S3CI55_GLAL2|nr:Crystal protein ET79 [Glarea lozoyensis ATCC 20868]EPE26167.1 Crystal protein ET79 [Glarea lozoyensis ATCC 20868]
MNGTADALGHLATVMENNRRAWRIPIRSVHVTVENHTQHTLILVNEHLHKGEWSKRSAGNENMDRTNPQARIEPGQTNMFLNGIVDRGSGVEGEVTYELEGTGKAVTLYWDNPVWGSNSYEERKSGDVNVQRHGAGSGDDSAITWAFSD